MPPWSSPPNPRSSAATPRKFWNDAWSDPPPEIPIRKSRRSRNSRRSSADSGGQLAELPAFPDRKLRFRILHIPGHVVDQHLQRVRAFGSQKTSRIRIGVDVRDRVRPQLVLMRLDPLR